MELLNSEDSVKRVGQNPDWFQIANTDRPWLHSCALQGPVKLQIRLAGQPCDVQQWKVTLFFNESDPEQPSSRFDVKLQGQVAISGLDLQGGSGGPTRGFTKELTVNASDLLTLELIPRDSTQPFLSGLEIRSE